MKYPAFSPSTLFLIPHIRRIGFVVTIQWHSPIPACHKIPILCHARISIRVEDARSIPHEMCFVRSGLFPVTATAKVAPSSLPPLCIHDRLPSDMEPAVSFHGMHFKQWKAIEKHHAGDHNEFQQASKTQRNGSRQEQWGVS